MLSSREAGSLGATVLVVHRRLRARRVAAGALAGAAVAAAPAWIVGGLAGGAIVLAGAILGGRARGRAASQPAASWIDAQVAHDDLVVSGAALVDGRAGDPGLGPVVVTAAAARTARIARPTLVPAVAALIAVAAILVVVARPRAADAPARAAETSGDRTATARPIALDPTTVGATTAGGAKITAPIANVGAAAPGDADALGAVKTSIAGVGHGEGDTAAIRDPAVGPDVSASAAGEAQDVSAPIGGASAELAAVPPRYRALVRAFVESP